MSLVCQSCSGRENGDRFGFRMAGEGAVAATLVDRFRKARRQYGLDRKITPVRTDLFRVPLAAGD